MINNLFLKITMAIGLALASTIPTATAAPALRHNPAAFNWKIGGILCRSIKPICTAIAIAPQDAQNAPTNPEELETTLSPHVLATADIL